MSPFPNVNFADYAERLVVGDVLVYAKNCP